MTTPDPFAPKTSAPTLSFSTRDALGELQAKPFGTRLGGTVSKAPEVVQARGYEGELKGKPLFWASDGKGKKTDQAVSPQGVANNPVNQIVINFSDAGDDGGEAALWVSYYPKDLYEAIQEALQGRAIEPGDKLFATLTGKRPVPGKNPAYTYSAEFFKGQGAFAPVAPASPAVAAAPPVTVVAPPAPVATPVVAPPAVFANQAEYDAHIAANWTHELLVQHGKGHLIPPVAGSVAPAPVLAPPAPVEDVAAKRAAAMAALSPEDRALLGL